MKLTKHPKLVKLSIAELQSMRTFINEGRYDCFATKIIEIEARGEYFGTDTWKARLKERQELIGEFDDIIRVKINALLS